MDLQGKTMVVVGGSSGIGRQIATDAAAAGVRVIIAGRNPESLAGTLGVAEGGGRLGAAEVAGTLGAAEVGGMVGADEAVGTVGAAEVAGSVGAAEAGGTVPADEVAGTVARGDDDAGSAGAVASGRGGIEVARVDLGDEGSIADLAERAGTVDYLVSVANASANGPVGGLEREAVMGAFDAKVIGAILLAKHFGPRFAEGGAMLLFSGIVGWRPSAGKTVTAATNGAVSFLASALAVELAPIRVNAISPGIIDSGAWDGLGDGKEKLFANTAAKVPARRVGQLTDISSAALLALTNPFITGETLHIDGGARYA